jgi:hypothetical protein
MKIPLDQEVKDIMSKIELDTSITSILIRNQSIYSLCRFYLESFIRENLQLTEENQGHKDNGKRKSEKLYYRITRAFVNRVVYFYPRMNKVIAKKKYRKQFDSIVNIEENDILIVATSGAHNSKFESSEFEEFVEYLKSVGKKIYFVQPNYNLKVVRNQKFDKYFLVDIFKDYKLSAKEHKAIKLFVNQLSLFGPGCENMEVNLISNIVSVQLSQSEQLDKIIKKVKPNFVFSKSLYSESWVVLACRINNVKSIEIQHGVFLQNNVYYCPLNELIRKKLLLPDYIGCLGKIWIDILRKQSLLWDDSNSFVYGNKNASAGKPLKDKRTQNLKVLIAFQPSQNKALSIYEVILRLFHEIESRGLKNFEFVLRFHPMETNKDIFKLKENNFLNVRISDSKRTSIYEELKSVDVLITGTSMTIYEALHSGIKVISFEPFRKLTIEKDIVFVNNEFELLKELENHSVNISKEEYLSELNFDFIEKLIA